MAYTDVITVATGDTWTAANHNTYIRDNFAAGVPAIFTAAGDIAYASGVKAASRLGIGAAGKILRASASLLPEWSNAVVADSYETDATYSAVSTSFSDITSMTVTLTLTVPSIIYLSFFGSVWIDESVDGSAQVQPVINSVAGQYANLHFPAHEMAMSISLHQLGIIASAGSIVCKAQMRTLSTSYTPMIAYMGLAAIAFPGVYS